jgi:hypothetical protein
LGSRYAAKHCILAGGYFSILPSLKIVHLGHLERLQGDRKFGPRVLDHTLSLLREPELVDVSLCFLQTGRLTVGRIGRGYLGANNVLIFRRVDNNCEMTRSLEVDKTATLHTLATVGGTVSFSCVITSYLTNTFSDSESPTRYPFSTHVFLHKSTVHSPGTPGVSKHRVEKAR